MSTNKLMDKLCWQPSAPNVEELILEIPESIVDQLLVDLSKLPKKADSNSILKLLDHNCRLSIWTTSHRKFLLNAPGLVCFRAPNTLSDLQLRAIYLLVARGLGKLNDRYGVMFDVKDRGFDHTKHAIPVSKTRASTGFHTDSTAKTYSPDIVGLLCLQPSLSGGRSLVANAANLYRWLSNHNKKSLDVLTKPLVRDVITPGVEVNQEAILNNQFPVFGFDSSGFKCRYMRYWIATGYEKAGIKPPDGLEIALNLIDNYFDDNKNVCSIDLKRGDMLFINNRFLCHNRSAFIDHEDPNKKRTLVRTWINCDI